MLFRMIFGKKNSDKRFLLFNLFYFFTLLYISSLTKLYNDYMNINVIPYSIIDNYNNFIFKSKFLKKFHLFCIKYNYSYIFIFLLTFIWIIFYSKMILKIFKRFLIICNIYLIYSSIHFISLTYYKIYTSCNYKPKYYNIWGLYTCYTYRENFLLFSLLMFFIFNRYHTSKVIKILFIFLNFINIYFSLIAKQIFLNQIINNIMISFLFWSLYDNPYYFKKSKKNDIIKDNKKKQQIELQIQKQKLYEDVIDINDM